MRNLNRVVRVGAACGVLWGCTGGLGVSSSSSSSGASAESSSGAGSSSAASGLSACPETVLQLSDMPCSCHGQAIQALPGCGSVQCTSNGLHYSFGCGSSQGTSSSAGSSSLGQSSS